LKESLCGFQFDFTHLNGKTYQIVNKNIGSVIQPESIKTIKGLGFQRTLNNTLEHGSLHIFFHVVYPDSISEDVQTALASILP
jgi:DnaJ-class molecular chaperone